MAKAAFYYANGTSYILNLLEVGFSVSSIGEVRIGDKVINPTTSLAYANIPGLNDKKYLWDGGPPNDPFPYMLNPDVWEATRIAYPASILGIGPSINQGILQTINHIKALPVGKPFALGGYSQGAAVMSGVYNEIRYSSGQLYSRRNDFLGGVCFGNPRRELNYRGEIGGSWSGTWDATHPTGYRFGLDATPTNSGGHGAFPTTGTWARLSGCDPTKWIEFTAPGDIFSSSGDTTTGLNWAQGINVVLGLLQSQYFGSFLTQVAASLIGVTGPMFDAVKLAFATGGTINNFIDSGEKTFNIGGSGHTSYPFMPPPNANGTIPVTTQTIDGKVYLRPSGLTCYQLALSWLEEKARVAETSPILLPPAPTTQTKSPRIKGWTTRPVKPSRYKPPVATPSYVTASLKNDTLAVTARPTASAKLTRYIAASNRITANRPAA